MRPLGGRPSFQRFEFEVGIHKLHDPVDSLWIVELYWLACIHSRLRPKPAKYTLEQFSGMKIPITFGTNVIDDERFVEFST